MAGDGFAVDTLGFLAVKFDIGRAISNLAARFRQGLALFGGHDDRQILLVGHHQVKPFAQHLRPGLAGFCSPGFLRDIGRINRQRDFGAGQVGHVAHHIATGRVHHGKCLA